jgi:uncharacterized repeat protein (TIGR01451 family)
MRRLLLVTVAIAALLTASAPALADSPQGDTAAAWPSAFTGYTRADGSGIFDPAGDVGCGSGYCDVASGAASGAGTLPSVLFAADGTNVFFRLRVKGDPAAPSAGGFASTAYAVALGVDGTKTAVVGLDGKSPSRDVVYVSNADGSQTLDVYAYPFDGASAGARAVSDGAGWFIDFQVPIARITQVAPSVTPTTPLQLFFGTSQANNRSVINKDYMTGDAIDFTGLSVVDLTGAQRRGVLDLDVTLVPVSGPQPPESNQTTVYELRLTARNTGDASLADVTVTDTLPAGVTVVSASTDAGTITTSGQRVTWDVGSVVADGAASAVVRVSVTPTSTQAGQTLTLSPGADGAATDSASGDTLTAAAPAVTVGPVGGPPPRSGGGGGGVPADGGGGGGGDGGGEPGDPRDDPGEEPPTEEPSGGGNGGPDDLTVRTEPGAPVVIELSEERSSLEIVDAPRHGSAEVDEETQTIRYTPQDGFVGTDEFTFRTCDTDGTCRDTTVTVEVGLGGDPGTPGDGEARRVSGASRVETAVAIAREQFPAADDVVLARADDYADALAGTPLAHDLRAPILLTSRERLDDVVADEVARLRARRVYLLGGEAALAPAIAADLADRGLVVERVGGTNRFDTARLVAQRLGGDEVFVVKGNDADRRRGWPDALAVGPLAAHLGAPILLVESDRMPAETLAAIRAIGASRGTVVGGQAAVPDAVAAEAGALLAPLERVAGANRYETSALVAERGLAAGLAARRVWVAQGDNWPDALAAGPAAAADGVVLLLVDADDLADSPASADWLGRHAADVDLVRLLGGPGALSAHVADGIDALLR